MCLGFAYAPVHNTITVDNVDDLAPFRPALAVPDSKRRISVLPRYVPHYIITVKSRRLNRDVTTSYDNGSNLKVEGTDQTSGYVINKSRWTSVMEKLKQKRLRLNEDKLSRELVLAKDV
jgi:hypothetical protein